MEYTSVRKNNLPSIQVVFFETLMFSHPIPFYR